MDGFDPNTAFGYCHNTKIWAAQSSNGNSIAFSTARGGNCKTWRSDLVSEDGGWLSTDVFVDNLDKKWHANLKISNLFVPLFERILEIPVTWLKGRASSEVLF
ncbi:hypothetical protein V6N13_077917 [Hibiscus sabdariffa]